MGAFGPLIGENPDYENDEFASRFTSDSVDSRDSLGNPRPKSGALLNSIMNIEGAKGHYGGFAGQWTKLGGRPVDAGPLLWIVRPARYRARHM